MPKKAIVSQPMRHVTDEEIVFTRRKAVRALALQGYECIDSLDAAKKRYADGAPTGVMRPPLYFLGEVLKIMSQCDAVYFCKGWEEARGCMVEHLAAELYGLEILHE